VYDRKSSLLNLLGLGIAAVGFPSPAELRPRKDWLPGRWLPKTRNGPFRTPWWSISVEREIIVW